MEYVQWVSAAIGAGTMGLFTWVLKHTVNSDIHPRKDSLVRKEVCEAERRRIAEGHTMVLEKIDDVKQDMKTGFRQIEMLIAAQGKRYEDNNRE